MSLATQLAPTGVLRASINLGNAVLTNGSFDEPGGITVDLSHEFGERLGVPVELLLRDAARKSVDAVRDGAADVCFLAVDPVRAQELAFTDPYVLIEGAYAVRDDSPPRTAGEVDREGSHTPMINGLGVLGWGIGGLEAELVMLGLPTTLRIPYVVGVRLTGRLTEGVTATDLALILTQRLRELGSAVTSSSSTARGCRP